MDIGVRIAQGLQGLMVLVAGMCLIVLSVPFLSPSCRVAGTGGYVNFAGAIRKLCDEGRIHDALQAVDYMHQQKIILSTSIFVGLLNKCINANDLAAGKEVHELIMRCGYESDTFLGSHLVRMFDVFERLLEAKQVFSKLSEPNVFSWSSIISVHVKLGKNAEAITLYHEMQKSRVKPVSHLFIAALKACSGIAALEQGREIHADIIENGFEPDLFIGTSLVGMYGKCRSVADADKLFDRLPNRNVVTWNALIAGHAQRGHAEKTLKIFQQMLHEGVAPNKVTFVCNLKACSSIAALDQGKQIHVQIIERGFDLDTIVGNALIDMFGKFGYLDHAQRVFDRLPCRDVITWSALIGGYAQHGQGLQALQIFQQMLQEGTPPDQATFVNILKACSNIAALQHGMRIHAHTIESGREFDLTIGTSLIGMYSKCGSLEDAHNVFNRLPKGNIATWNAVISEYAQHSNYSLVSQIFADMQEKGLKPNEITFVCLLLACSHVGLVDEGCLHFKSMRDNHHIQPTPEHVDCMVDLLGRVGYVSYAEELLETIPFKSDIVGWTALLSSCVKYCNVCLGRRCFDNVLRFDGRRASAYVLLSKLYENAGMQKDAKEIEKQRNI